MLSTESYWRIRDDAAWVDHGDRVVALALSDPRATPLALEGSAALIWRALHQGGLSTGSAIASRVADETALEADVVIDDVSSFLVVLATASLVAADVSPARH